MHHLTCRKKAYRRMGTETCKVFETMFFRLVAEYSDRQSVTEQLKSKNQFLWIQKMNNILACVREVVENDIIYS